MTCLILLADILKTLDLLRYIEKVGRLIKLVEAVIIDVLTLFQFFSAWILCFSFFYQILGFSIHKDVSKIDTDNLWDYVLASWKVGTKGSGTSVSSYWDSDSDFMFMHHIIMIAQIFNEIYLKIIILSFLIAVVKGSFDGQRKIHVENKFRDRVELNMKYATFRHLFGIWEIWSCKVIWAKVDDERKFLQPSQMDRMEKEIRSLTKYNEALVKENEELKAKKDA